MVFLIYLGGGILSPLQVVSTHPRHGNLGGSWVLHTHPHSILLSALICTHNVVFLQAIFKLSFWIPYTRKVHTTKMKDA